MIMDSAFMLDALQEAAEIQPPQRCHFNITVEAQGFYLRAWWHPPGTLIYRNAQARLPWSRATDLPAILRGLLASVNPAEPQEEQAS